MNRRTLLALPLCAVVKSDSLRGLRQAVADMDRASDEYQRRMVALTNCGDELIAIFENARRSAEDCARTLRALT